MSFDFIKLAHVVYFVYSQSLFCVFKFRKAMILTNLFNVEIFPIYGTQYVTEAQRKKKPNLSSYYNRDDPRLDVSFLYKVFVIVMVAGRSLFKQLE